MNTDEHEQSRTWLSVDEAYALCLEHGLPRTKKTVRSWCRHDHVTGQKQTTPTGERWVMDHTSLLVKINAEKELQAQFAPVRQGSNPSEPLQSNKFSHDQNDQPFEPVQARSNRSEPVHTSADRFEPVQTEQVKELERQVRSLEIDKAVRDRQIEFLSRQNEKGQDSLLGQSRYIGHLETELMRLGGRPDQRFLSPPMPDTSQDASISNPSSHTFKVEESPT
ncbi:MAG: hypothetical protein K8F59_15355 [Rhodobacteraceae bacterium]|nr:hypothetical protein [Paracoccaceae bacterium]